MLWKSYKIPKRHKKTYFNFYKLVQMSKLFKAIDLLQSNKKNCPKWSF